MIYTELEIDFLIKCLKYYKKFHEQIIHDPEGILWFPEKELKIKKHDFFILCDYIFKKAQKENLINVEDYDYGAWELFNISMIDTKIVIGTLYEGHYAIGFGELY
jgi:hypothetical protein